MRLGLGVDSVIKEGYKKICICSNIKTCCSFTNLVVFLVGTSDSEVEMSISNSKREALAEAISLAGGQAAFAVLVSTEDRPVSQQLVSDWFRKGELPAELVLRVELKTGIARDVLRPDVFLLPADLLAA